VTASGASGGCLAFLSAGTRTARQLLGDIDPLPPRARIAVLQGCQLCSKNVVALESYRVRFRKLTCRQLVGERRADSTRLRQTV